MERTGLQQDPARHRLYAAASKGDDRGGRGLPDPEEAEGFRELHRIRSEEQLLEDLESKLSEIDRWLWPMQRGRGGL